MIFLGAFAPCSYPPVTGASAQPAGDTNATEMRLIAEATGRHTSVAVAGQHAFVSDGRSVLVADISDPGRPIYVGRSSLLTDSVNQLMTHNGNVYAVVGTGLQVLDVVDPRRPRLLGSADVGGATVCMAAFADHAVLGGDRVWIVDVTNPRQPLVLASVPPDHGPVIGVSLYGRFAYVLHRSVLRVLDIGDPLKPTIRRVLPASLTGFVAGNGHALAISEDGLIVYDTSVPTSPHHVATVSTPGPAKRVAVWGQFAYVSYLSDGAQPGGLSVIEVSSGHLPRRLGTFFLGGARPTHLSAFGGYIYATYSSYETYSGFGGLQVIDATDPTDPLEALLLRIPGVVAGVAADDRSSAIIQLAWRSGADVAGVGVLDVADPSHPVPVAMSLMDDHPIDAALRPPFVFVLTAGVTPRFPLQLNGLSVFELAPSSELQPIAALALEPGPLAGATCMTVAAGYAYIAAGSTGLRVVDLTVPHQPRELQPLNEVNATSVFADQGYLYVVESSRDSSTLVVLDLSDPGRPRGLSSVTTVRSATTLAVADGTAYVGGATAIGIIDVRSPGSPVVVARHSMSGGATDDIAVANGHLLVTRSGPIPSELHVVNVEDPLNPYLVAVLPVCDVYDKGPRVATSASSVYVAGGQCGVLIAVMVSRQLFLPWVE